MSWTSQSHDFYGGGGVWKGSFSDRNGYNGVQEEGRGTGTIGVFDA